jgi:hypothetical protein
VTVRAVRSIRVTAPGRPAMLDDVEREPGAGQAWVATEWSGISAGPEVALVSGTDPHHQGGWDADLRAFGPGGQVSGYPVRGLACAPERTAELQRQVLLITGSPFQDHDAGVVL